MTLPTQECLAAIAEHSRALAAAARLDLAAPVEHCPGWSVADLVRHVTGVHWFWGTVVAELADQPPAESRHPAREPDDRAVDTFLDGAERLVDVLRRADPGASCWTWAPTRHDVAFVVRHQVQEAAVHHWDAAHATGGNFRLDPRVAADAVDEFLTFSVASVDDPAEPGAQGLDGRFGLEALDTGDQWALSDGPEPATVRVQRGLGVDPVLRAPAADLLLWLYGRVPPPESDVPDALFTRFRALVFTA